MDCKPPTASDPRRGPLRLAAAAALLILVGPPASPCRAGQSLMLLNSKAGVAPYEMAVKGFRLVYNEVFFTVNLDAQVPPESTAGPDMVVAIGSNALEAALKLPPSVALIFLMTLKPNPESLRGRAYVGIETLVSLPEYLAFISGKFPHLTSVGLLTSESKVASEARNFVGPLRIEVAEVSSLAKAAEAFRALAAKADCILLRPDPGVVSKETTAYILQRGRETGKPVFTYSEALVREGAFLGLVAPYTEMGMQAARIARGGAAFVRSRSAMVPPDHTVTFINRTTMRALGIKVPEGLLRQAENID